MTGRRPYEITTDNFVISSSPANTPIKRRRSNSSPELVLNKKKQLSDTEHKLHSENMNVNDLLEKFNIMLDEKIKLLPNKEDFNRLENQLIKLTDENAAMKTEISNLKGQNLQLKNTVDNLIMFSKRKRLIFGGIPIIKEGEEITAVKELCSSILGIKDELLIDRAFKVGRKDRENRPLLVEFIRTSDVVKILKNTKNLKGTGIWVNKDLPYDIRNKKKKLLEIRFKIKTVHPDARIIMSDSFFVYNNKKFHWEDGRGLMTGEEDGVQVLKQMTNQQFTMANLRNIKVPNPKNC